MSFLAVAVIILQCIAFAVANPRAVGMEFQKLKYRNTIDRRDGSLLLTLNNEKSLYTVELDIGTPPQKFIVLIDTGSSDLFVPSIDEDYCQIQPEDCSFTGAYVANKSSTSESLGTPFIIEFTDESGYNGTFYKDTVTIGGSTLENVQFGVTTKTAGLLQSDQGFTGKGLIGVGFESNEATKDFAKYGYPNIITELYNNGLIGAKAFSLYLNGQDAPTGSILFGGVDTSLYNGPLISTPILAKRGEVTEYAVEWTSFIATSSSGNTDLFPPHPDEVGIYTVLDSGTTLSYIPSSLTRYLYSYLGASTESGEPVVPCNISTTDVNLAFGFGGPDGPKITVPISNFIFPHSENPNLRYADNTPACLLTLRETTEPKVTLGDNFLHSAYVVYDLDSKTIAIAEANLDPSDPSNIVEIKPGASGIPEVQTLASGTPLSTTVISSQVTAFSPSGAETTESPQEAASTFVGDPSLTIYPSGGSITATGTGAIGTAVAGTGTGTGSGHVNYTGTAISPSISPFSAAPVAHSRVQIAMAILGVGMAGLMMAM